MQRTLRRLPFVVALIFGMLWGLTYLFLGRLHSMWSMYDKEFPLLLSPLVGVHTETMSPVVGTIVAFTDGALVAFAASGLFVLGMRRLWHGNNAHSPRRLAILTVAAVFVLLAAFARGCPQ